MRGLSRRLAIEKSMMEPIKSSEARDNNNKSTPRTDWDAWDEEIIKDMQAGVFDRQVREAIKDYEEGRTEEL